ncbi:hypothetical protein FXN65_10570 [Metapseudomonas lalkuanensis]|uniref:Uncharacterized protein n=1 Tax=Metapseudomonas lalkuanensis TaxID=2604832 RepID=A0A5J6QJ64_9GAMM|nr:hypothetical protein [Pseudomonas lalkuanensis]QEY62497.1 hypothetical protein FXN65_10570 [Pseudomonas lalkuanensis]
MNQQLETRHLAGLQWALDNHLISDLVTRKHAEELIAAVRSYDAAGFCGDPYAHDCGRQHCHTSESHQGPAPALVLPAVPQSAARDVLAERLRQIEAEGWTPEHDDEHKYPSDLGIAAACYALCACGEAPHVVFGIERFPWPGKGCGEGRTGPSTKGGSRRMLVKAGALILAEIERRDRAESKESSHG